MKMLTKSILFAAFMALVAAPAFGQAGDTKIVTGVINFQNQDFEGAMKALDEGLADPSQVKPKNLPKGYFHRAKTRMMLMAQAAQKGDTVKLKSMENALFDVYSDYKKTLETDDGKWADDVERELKTFKFAVLQGSFGLLNMVYKKEVKGDDRKEALVMVVKYSDMLKEMDAKDWLSYDLSGQANLLAEDSTKALADFAKAGEVYTQNLPATPDLGVGYTFYRASVISRYHGKNMDKAYELLKSGKALIESENTRAQGMTNLNAEMKAKKAEEYQDVRNDLRSVEMDLLLNYPEKRAEAVAEFKKAVETNPNDYIIHVAYANLLELEDQNKAVEMYKKAISIKPGEEIAVFNLGALYNNMAKSLLDQANETNDAVKAQGFKDQGNELLAKALEQFERCVEINPKSIGAVRAAKQVAISLNDMDKYKKYKEMEQQLSAG